MTSVDGRKPKKRTLSEVSENPTDDKLLYDMQAARMRKSYATSKWLREVQKMHFNGDPAYQIGAGSPLRRWAISFAVDFMEYLKIRVPRDPIVVDGLVECIFHYLFSASPILSAKVMQLAEPFLTRLNMTNGHLLNRPGLKQFKYIELYLNQAR